MKLHYVGIAIVLLFLLGCTYFQNSINVSLNSPFDLRANQTAYVQSEALDIHILNVSDSRCPSDVVCIWAGEVSVEFVVLKDRSIAKGVTVKEGSEGTVDYGFNYGRERYIVQVIEVKPYPISTLQIKPSDYVVTLKISKEIDNRFIPVGIQ